MNVPDETGPVFTRCPVTGVRLDTGIETDRRALAGAIGFVGRVYCAHCGVEHSWTRDAAWIAVPGERVA